MKIPTTTLSLRTQSLATAFCVLAMTTLVFAEPPGADAKPTSATLPPATKLDPLAGTLTVDPAVTGKDAEEVMSKLLLPRSDLPSDWQAGLEPLHYCGEPRWLPPCVPPPGCHPALPPQPYDLIGAIGMPTSGPRYRGPCCPKTGTHDDGPLPRVHRVHDRAFDWFYRTK